MNSRQINEALVIPSLQQMAVLALVKEHGLQVMIEAIEAKDESEDCKRVLDGVIEGSGKSYTINCLSVFRPLLDPIIDQVKNLLDKVVRSNNNEVLKIVNAKPYLLKLRGSIDFGLGRKIDNVTSFQAALYCSNEYLFVGMRKIYIDAYPESDELDNQFDEVFPKGYLAHLEEQKSNAFNFDKLINSIEHVVGSQHLLYMLTPDNNAKLGRALTAFKQEFQAKIGKEIIFNPYHFLNAFKLLNEKFFAPSENNNRITTIKRSKRVFFQSGVMDFIVENSPRQMLSLPDSEYRIDYDSYFQEKQLPFVDYASSRIAASSKNVNT